MLSPELKNLILKEKKDAATVQEAFDEIQIKQADATISVLKVALIRIYGF